MSVAEIQEGLFVMKWRTFIPMMIGIILSTNTASIFYQHQQHNTEQIKYNKERADRIAKRHTDELMVLMQIEHLKQELNDCNKEKNRSYN